jgi:serine O-acetyltransferase
VWVGPNVTISGRVHVGSGSVVGANSLVVSDIPENGVAIGVPARVVSYGGSAKLIHLDEP